MIYYFPKNMRKKMFCIVFKKDWLTFLTLTCKEYTLKEIKDYTIRSPCLWSKTTLIPGDVGGTGVDPPTCKTGTFYLRSLALCVLIFRNFQSNGANL